VRKSKIWDRTFAPHLFDIDSNSYEFTHGLRGIKTKSWTELPSPQKPPGVQISIVIVNWNRPLDVVESSVTSVLNQSFPPENFEVILVDDASDLSPKTTCQKIVKEYPNHNFRAYLLTHTRSYTCPHAYNVGLKRAAGWIVATLQSEAVLDDTPERDLDDTYPKQPALEGMWRHHNAQDKIALTPRRLNEWAPNVYEPWWFYPQDVGMSIRKTYCHAVHGFVEHSVGDPAIDYMCNLTREFKIKFTEDLNMQVIHRDYLVPENLRHLACEIRPTKPNTPPTREDWLVAQRPDWLGGHWGELGEDEEKNVIRTGVLNG